MDSEIGKKNLNNNSQNTSFMKNMKFNQTIIKAHGFNVKNHLQFK